VVSPSLATQLVVYSAAASKCSTVYHEATRSHAFVVIGSRLLQRPVLGLLMVLPIAPVAEHRTWGGIFVMSGHM
jgi:hypothetical protein